VVQRRDPRRERGDGGLVGHVDLLNADIHAAIRFDQIVYVTSGGDNLAAIVGDG
jgi:hypothetical protein